MTMDGGFTLAALAAGLVAGLGLAMPMGAVSVLLLRAGIVGGLRAGLPAAAGVAVVDAAYCLLAVALGALVAPALAALGTLPGVLAGLVLMGFGVRIAVVEARTRRSAAIGERPRQAPQANTKQPRAARDAPQASPASGRANFATFATITAANPLTLVYFAALTTSVTTATAAGTGGTATAPVGATVPSAALFIAGVAAASFLWQLGLAGCGALVGALLPRGAMTVITLAAAALVTCLGAVLLVSALLSQTPAP